MKRPQLEDGYTRIANELLEAMGRIRINGEAMQVLMVIIRKTYGFSKKSDVISLSQFVLATGINKTSVLRALKKLVSMNIVYQKVNDTGNMYSIIKQYDRWKPLTKKITVYQKVNHRLPKRDIQKKLLQKKLLQNIYVCGTGKENPASY